MELRDSKRLSLRWNWVTVRDPIATKFVIGAQAVRLIILAPHQKKQPLQYCPHLRATDN